MKIKICGLTSFEDALMVVEAGADMLGFVFYPRSPRYVSPAECALFVKQLCKNGYAFVSVGVFVNQSPGAVREVLDFCGLDLAQLQGDEPHADVKELQDRAYKAVRPQRMSEARKMLDRYAGIRDSAPSLLVDAYKSDQYGGTGSCVDWSIAAEVARSTSLLLAGGLTSENVTTALSTVRPWGVDVSSGVESEPGIKDQQKVEAFINTVRMFERENVV
jgi:phosphoribosylanthranilate isomerase